MSNNNFWELMVLELIGEVSGGFAAKTVEFLMSNRVVSSTVVAERR
jgi:hypothetical protein